MTDRELLELAAKAAGYSDASWNNEKQCIETAQLPGFRCYWNPLTDDGDALRLAVKLRINVVWEGFNLVYADNTGETVKNGDDSCAVTRRAIVRAAAAEEEIRRSQP